MKNVPVAKRSAKEIDAEMKAIREEDKRARIARKEKLLALKAQKPDKSAEVVNRFKLEIDLHKTGNIGFPLPENLGLVTIGKKDAEKRARKIAALRADGKLI